MRSWLAIALMAGCSTPNYGNGHLQCAPNGRLCPDGFYCADDKHCWRVGSGPPAGSDLATSTDDMAAPPGSDLAGKNPSTCPMLNVLFCDGFETDFQTNWNNVHSSNGNTTRDSARRYRGDFSFLSETLAANPNTGPDATVGKFGFAVNGTIYVRLWAYFPSPLPADFNQFLVLTDSGGNNGASLATSKGHLLLNVFSGSIYMQSMTAVPLDRWTCIQLDMEQAGHPSGPFHVQLDSAPVADISVTAAEVPITNVYVGQNFYNNSNPVPDYTAWFDEVIVDNKPTTCSE